MPTAAMRVVLYDDETMEPLTVMHIPSWGVEALVSGRRLNVPMVLPIKFHDCTDEIGPIPKTYVQIWFEEFVRNGRRHWFAFTREGEDAMLCKAVFLPGQQREVQSRERTAFMQGLLAAITQ